MSTYYGLLFDRKYEEAKKLMASLIPPKLYKFVSLSDDETANEKKFNTLEEKRFWVSAAEEENDPYDFQAMYINKAKLIGYGWPKDVIERIAAGLDFRQQFYVGCFTANNEQFLPMWAYYTNNHRGFCVEYDVVSSETFHKVSYEENRIGTAVITANLYEAFRVNHEADKEFYARLALEAAYVKHKSWEWENEYRILFPMFGTKSLGKSIPVEEIGLKTSKIVAGVNCSTENKAKLFRASSAIGATYKQAKVSETEFGIDEE
jgi:hypothetical protein